MGVNNVRRILIGVLVVLLVIDVAAIAVLLSPAGHSRQERQQAYDSVRAQLMEKRREALPARDMDKKLEMARQEIASFYENRLPAHYSEISQSLNKLAQENHVQVLAIKYEPKPADISGLTMVQIGITVHGNYASQMEFMNALERSKLLYVVNGISFGGTQPGPQQQGKGSPDALNVQVSLNTYMRSTEAPPANEARS
jgi:type IV pilus assembly protein PilO